MNPKVFISHASEDKDRFVIEFAIKLRESGVDAWVDEWEIQPGDSLVDKIFEEGLKKADSIIIVLSEFSINKPWVREELNVSMVNKISKGTKIIPILLDNCTIPESLTSILWVKIVDLTAYESDYKKIVSSIFKITEKPSLGCPPVYTSTFYHKIEGLTKVDNLVLKEACNYIVQNHNHFCVDPDIIFDDETKLGLSHEEINDCIEMLDNKHYFSVSHFIGGSTNYGCNIQVTQHGFEEYAQVYISNYNMRAKKVCSAIVNEKLYSDNDLVAKLKEPIAIIHHILNILESENHIKLTEYSGGSKRVNHVSPSLRRMLG